MTGRILSPHHGGQSDRRVSIQRKGLSREGQAGRKVPPPCTKLSVFLQLSQAREPHPSFSISLEAFTASSQGSSLFASPWEVIPGSSCYSSTECKRRGGLEREKKARVGRES
jgi:hypothetical protein